MENLEKIKIERKTWARHNFDFALNDVRSLLKTHDSQTKRKRGKPDESLEVLKRAGVILVVSAWETFIEDTLLEQLTDRLKKASNPQQLRSTFNSVAENWLNPPSDKLKPKPPDLMNWTEDGWKGMILDKLQDDITSLNTPNSKNLKILFKKYLDLKIEHAWRWRSVSFAEACRKLDAVITLRGSIAHRYKSIVPLKSKGVRRDELANALILTRKLAQCTEEALGIAPHARYM